VFDCAEAERRTGITDDTGLRQHGWQAFRKAFAGAQARKFGRQHRRMAVLPAGVPKLRQRRDFRFFPRPDGGHGRLP
jgi:hypothetical protein